MAKYVEHTKILHISKHNTIYKPTLYVMLDNTLVWFIY